MNLTPERWQQVASLYEAAVDLDNASRETFLREACAGDDALRREVDSLIRDGASEPFILDAPVWTAAAWLLAAGDELRAGVSLGPYRIEAPLGAGGMGQVFRATDTRLDRQVAIKLLAPHVALDPQLRARFAREARAGAALAHPHICAIYDVGLHGGVEFLVMEYLEGETLAARLSRDRLPTARALAYAIEIAGALDHAHRQGVIHRDLKPANVMVTARGTILLDFGLAKLRPPGRPVTGDVEVTRKGTVLGSTRYMAPEQIEGREADTRTDLFALGAVAYEMLTGRKAFEGESRTKVAAAILEREPLPVSAHLPLATPVLDHVIRRCLAKDPDERWQSAGDVMRELKWAAASVEALRSGQPSVAAAATSAQRLWRRRDVVATVAGLVTGLAVWRATRSTAVVSEDASFKILLPATQRLTAGNYQNVAVSPTGDVVYAAAEALWLRRRSALDATVIAGTESTGAHSPSFSPDGEWLAFFSRGHIRRARVLGGPLSLTIAAAAPPLGLSWATNDRILYGQGSDGIWEAVVGQEPRQIIAVKRGEQAHGPQLLPDGSVLFTLLPAGVSSWYDDAKIVLQQRAAKEPIVVADGRDARYVETGHLVYADRSQLVAFPFDPVSGRKRDEPVALDLAVAGATPTISGAAHFAVAPSGTLVYVPPAGGGGALVWVDRAGNAEPMELKSRWGGRISEDGMSVAAANGGNLLVSSLERPAWRRITRALNQWFPLWTKHGDRVVFMHHEAGLHQLAWTLADGSGPVEPLLTIEDSRRNHIIAPGGWTRDGDILFTYGTPEEPQLGRCRMNSGARGEREWEPLPNQHGDAAVASVSPDGLWMAYQSRRSGRFEVYAEPLDAPGHPAVVISDADGGWNPAWSAGELFYRRLTDGAMMAVPVATSRGLERGTPFTLFDDGGYAPMVPTATGSAGGRPWDIASKGPYAGRFLMTREPPPGTAQEIHVIQGWVQSMQQLVPARS